MSRKRHEEHCRVCRHARRKEIDRAFLEWQSPREIATAYGLSKTAVYRHVEATGLVARRRKNRLLALDRVVERVGEVKMTAGAVIAAIRLSAEIQGMLGR